MEMEWRTNVTVCHGEWSKTYLQEKQVQRSCFDKAPIGNDGFYGRRNEQNEMSIAEIAVSPSSRASRTGVIEYR